MIKAVLFDMDGVLIDSETPYRKIEEEMYKEIGINVSEEEALESMGRVVTEWWASLKERHGFKESVEDISELENKRYMEYLFNDEEEKIKMEGIEGLLQKLKEKGLRLAVASSSAVTAINHVMDMFELDAFFEVKLSGTEVKNGKPAPDIFLKAAELLKVEPENCLVVEDSHSGIKAAKAAGMTCVAYLSAPFGAVDYTLADYQVEHYDDFFEIVTIL